METTVKSQKRKNFLNELMDVMMQHEFLSRKMSRKGMDEPDIQRAIFSHLENNKSKGLIPLISKHFNCSRKKAEGIVEDNFIYEKKKGKTLHNFSFFSTNQRPDAELSIYDLRIAFEIKKGNDSVAVRGGIGQSIVYSTQYDFVLYFFVDTTAGGDIESAQSGEKEAQLTKSLWDAYNIRFVVV